MIRVEPQPNQVVNAQPAPIGPGELFDREVNHLRDACLDKHNDKGQVVGALIGVAILVAAVWVGVLTNSILVALAIFLVGGKVVGNLYQSLRNSDYIDARRALSTSSFRQYIQRPGLDLSVDSILIIYKEHKKHLNAQAQAFVAAHV